MSFSKTVQNPTTAAPVQPLQTNTGSATTDALAAVQFGLDLFQRSETRSQQAALLQQDANAKIATESVLSRREELIASGVSGTKLEFEVLNEIKKQSAKYGLPTTELRKTVGTFQGKTTTQLLMEAQTDAEKAVIQAKEQRRNDEAELAGMQGYLPPEEWGTDYAGLSDQELQQKILIAKSNKSIIDARQSKVALARASRNNTEEQRALDVRNFSDQASQQISANLGGQIVTQLGGVDLNDPSSIREAINGVNSIRAALPAQIREAANAQGITLSKAEVDVVVAEVSVGLDNFSRFMTRKDTASLGDDIIKEQVSNMMFQMQKGTPQQQAAANALIIGKMFGVPPELSTYNSIASLATQMSVAGRFTDGITQLEQDPQISVAPNSDKAGIIDVMKKRIKGLFSPAVDTPDEQYKTVVTDSLLRNISGSRREQREFVKSGGYQSYLEGLASDTAPSVLAQEDVEEVREQFAPLSQEVLAGAISSFMRTVQNVQMFSGSLGAPERTAKGFNIHPDTLQISPAGVGTRQTAQSRKMNALIQNTLKAYKNLGYTDQEIQMYKEDILRSFGMVVTQEEQINAQGE